MIRINNAGQLMLDEQLDAKDYREIKEEYERKIRKLEARIKEMTFMNSNLKEHLDFFGELCPNSSKHCMTEYFSVKQQLIGAVFLKKIFLRNIHIEPRG